MKNRCSNKKYSGCPASMYMICEGFENGKNCWELEEKPCCPVTDSSVCKTCRVAHSCHAKIV